jgi:hypothetical protein
MGDIRRKTPAIPARPEGQRPAFPAFTFSSSFQAAPPSPVPPFRQQALPERGEDRAVPRPHFFQVVPFVPAAVAVHPVIPFRQRRLDERDQDRPFPKPQFFQVVPVAVTPLIPFRTRRLSELVAPDPRRYPFFEYKSLVEVAAAEAKPVIAFRYGRDVLAAPPAFVPSQFGEFPYWQPAPAAANPVIPFRYGRELLEDRRAFVLPRYHAFPYVEQPASQGIAVRIGQGILGEQPEVVAPQFGKFPYFQEFVAPASPAIPIQTRVLAELQERPQALVRPRYGVLHFPDFIPPVISNVVATVTSDTTATITWTTDEPSNSQVQYGPTVAYGSVTTVDQADVTSHSVNLTSLSPGSLYHFRVRSRDPFENLAISGDFQFTTTPFRLIAISHGFLPPDAAEPLRAKPGYFQTSSFQQEAAASPVIPIQVRRLVELQGEAINRYPSFASYSFTDIVTPGAASPVIPFRYGRELLQGAWAFIPLGYQRFPYLGVPPAPAHPFSAIQTRRLSELADARFGEFPRFDSYSYTDIVPAGPANPVIPFRRVPPVKDAGQFLLTPYFQEFPGFIPPSSPVIAFRVRRLEELATEPRTIQPFYLAFPYFQQPAPARPVIEPRIGQDVQADRQAFVPPAFQRFPYFQPALPAKPIIPFVRGQWLNDAVPSLDVRPGYYRFPYFQLPAPGVEPVIPTGLVIEGCAGVSGSACEGCGSPIGFPHGEGCQASGVSSVLKPS